jgi:hypothetical protein
MVKPIKRTMTTGQTRVPVLWRDYAWSARVQILPGVITSIAPPASPVPGRWRNADVRTFHGSGGRGCRPRQFAKPRFAGECARFAGAAVSLPARRRSEQAPRTLPRSGTSRIGADGRGPRLGRVLAGHRAPLLALAGLPLGGAPSLNLNIRHVFENTPSDLL